MRSLSTPKNRLLTIIFGLAVAIQFAYLLVGFASNIAFYQRVTTQTVEPSKWQREPGKKPDLGS